MAQGVIATCDPGDEVIVPAPFWVSYPEMCRLAGADPVVVQTSAEDGFLLSAETLAARLSPNSRLLILCSPSNPSGAVYSEAALAAIAEVVAQHPRLLVLADEIYEHIIYPPARHVSFASLPGMRERTLTVNGFSKAFAMTGWRLGYLAAPKHFAKAAASIQSQTTSGPSTISQEAGLAALALGENGGAPVSAMRAAFLKRRDYVVGRFKKMRVNEDDITLESPEGAFYVFPDVSAIVGEGCVAEGFGPVADGDALCRYLLRRPVALVPGSAFGSPEAWAVVRRQRRDVGGGAGSHREGAQGGRVPSQQGVILILRSASEFQPYTRTAPFLTTYVRVLSLPSLRSACLSTRRFRRARERTSRPSPSRSPSPVPAPPPRRSARSPSPAS